MTAGLDAEGEQLLAWLRTPAASARAAAEEDAALTRTLLSTAPTRPNARAERASGPGRPARRATSRPTPPAPRSPAPRSTSMEAVISALAPSLPWGQVQELARGWASVGDASVAQAWCQAGLSARDYRMAAACAQRGLTPQEMSVRVEGARVAARLRGGESLDAVIGLLQATGKWSPPRG